MSLNNTPSAERLHIGIFGKRNAGKSSVINALTGQNLAIVSDIKGTTTDPVLKSMELLPLGPVAVSYTHLQPDSVQWFFYTGTGYYFYRNEFLRYIWNMESL